MVVSRKIHDNHECVYFSILKIRLKIVSVLKIRLKIVAQSRCAAAKGTYLYDSLRE